MDTPTFEGQIVAVLGQQGEVYVGLYLNSTLSTVALTNAVLLYDWTPGKGETRADAPNWVDAARYGDLDLAVSAVSPLLAVFSPQGISVLPEASQAEWKPRLRL